MNPDSQIVAKIPDVLAYFALGTSLDILPIKDGISNRNFFANTEHGDYIVKFLVNQPIATLENDLAIQKQLKRVGIHAPEYLQSADGSYVYKEGDIKAVISRKIDGVPPRKASPPLAYTLGQTLATFHFAVTNLPNPQHTGLLHPSVSGVQSEIFAQSFPRGIIHGDFHLGNALVSPHNPDQLIAILDFEEAHDNQYLADLAVMLMAVCASLDGEALDLRLTQAAISGYQSVRALTDQEKLVLPAAVQYAAHTWIKWFLAHGYTRYATQQHTRLNSFMQLDTAQIYVASET